MNEKFDLIVIGAGPGGYEAALDASKIYGNKVLLVENRELGGTCLNRGCIPTKALLHTANLYREIESHGDEIGIAHTASLSCDLEKMQARKRAVVDTLREGIAGQMKAGKVQVKEGLGTIRDAHHVQITASDGTTDIAETEHILIATGSVPKLPPIPGADIAGVVTSDEMLEMQEIPESLIIVGAGAIGCEFASLFSALGTKVTMIEALDRPVATMDKEFGRALKMMLTKERGVDLYTNAMVSEICEGGDGVVCHFEEKGEAKDASGQVLLISAGRKANTAGLVDELTEAGIREAVQTGHVIDVNERFETKAAGIYAIGDVIGGVQLAHMATAEGRCAVAAMNGAEPPVDLAVVPACIYTTPEMASVGIGQDAAKKAGRKVITKKGVMGANGKSVLEMQDRGTIKVIADAETQQIIGAQMMCARATDMVDLFSQAIVSGLTIEEMSKVIYPHPTFGEAIGELLR